MLHERWVKLAGARRSEIALIESASARAWSFADLEAAVDRAPLPPSVVCPTGRDATFVIDVLRAWRHGRILCPLDAGQTLATVPALPADCVHLKLTSATTSAPRLVAFSATQLAADADQIVETMKLRPEWPNVGVLSLAHSYGFSSLVLPLLLHGIPLVLAESTLPESLRRASEGLPHITLPAVPALWRGWFEAGAIPGNTRLAVSAGAPLPLPLEYAIFERHRLKVHNFYGATECGGIAFDASAEPRPHETQVGGPMSGVALSVAHDGCLEVRGPAVGIGYLPPDPGHLGHGRYHSHDLVELSANGVHLRGRASDLINVAGRKVAPEVIESVAASLPGVAACVVFGVPEDSAARNERIVAIVSTAGTEPFDMDSLRNEMLHRLPAWQVPREWRRVPEIPVNARGKISRADWRQRFLAGDLG